MTDRALMQQALEALEKHAMQRTYAGGVYIANVAIALRERLAQPEQCQYPDCKCATENPCLKGLAQPEQKPVSGVVLDRHGFGALVKNGSEDWHCKKHNARRLYTTPPQRKPLTEKRIEELYSFWVVDCQDIVGFARAVERTVKGEA